MSLEREREAASFLISSNNHVDKNKLNRSVIFFSPMDRYPHTHSYNVSLDIRKILKLFNLTRKFRTRAVRIVSVSLLLLFFVFIIFVTFLCMKNKTWYGYICLWHFLFNMSKSERKLINCFCYKMWSVKIKTYIFSLSNALTAKNKQSESINNFLIYLEKISSNVIIWK